MILRPRRYVTAEEYHATIRDRVIQIQCFVRQAFARVKVRRLIKERDERIQAIANVRSISNFFGKELQNHSQLIQKNTKRAEYADKKRQKEIESRLHPKTTKDFEILFNGLESMKSGFSHGILLTNVIAWRTQETDQINSLGFTKEERLAALAELMNQEAILLQKIDRLKIAATQENKEKSIYRLLESVRLPMFASSLQIY